MTLAICRQKNYIVRVTPKTSDSTQSPPHGSSGRPKGWVSLEIIVEGPLFIGFKASRALRHMIDTLTDVQKVYVSGDDSGFLRSFEIGEDLYIGKCVADGLSTDHVDDIRRNVLSILRKLGPVVPLPTTMRIFACHASGTQAAMVDGLSTRLPAREMPLSGVTS